MSCRLGWTGAHDLPMTQVHISVYSVLAHHVFTSTPISVCSANVGPSWHLISYPIVIPSQRKMPRLERCDLDGVKSTN